MGKCLPNLFAVSPPHQGGCCWASRTRSVNHTRPFASIPTLRGSPFRFHMFSPKLGDGVGAALKPDTIAVASVQAAKAFRGSPNRWKKAPIDGPDGPYFVRVSHLARWVSPVTYDGNSRVALPPSWWQS